MQIADLTEAVHIFHNPARHGELNDSCLQLPAWFDQTIDADDPAFRDQQIRLWQEITERAVYDPDRDEDTPEIMGMDAIYRPSFYGTGRSLDAGVSLIALGHILLRSQVNEGARALECGAGFAQNALAFARLGMKVDTVDVCAGFCDMVRQAGERYKVDLTPHRVPFGTNPAGEDGAYDLILFYESFHHCLEFKAVIPKLRAMLKDDGRILLAGEPVDRSPGDNMPYPWGIRLHWSNVAVMRQRGWMELGFQEAYLVRQFANAGMIWRYHSDPNTPVATIYDFHPWRDPIEMNAASLTRTEDATWHGGEPNGRWTAGHAKLGIPSRDGRIAVDMTNFHDSPRTGQVSLCGQAVPFEIAAGAMLTVELPQSAAIPDQLLEIRSDVQIAGDHDRRPLGVFVERIRPI